MKKNHIYELMKETTKERFTEKKQNILEAAIELFAQKGYANTSTSEIAKRAGVAEGTIFRHYGTKEKLLLAILVPFIKNALPKMAEEIFTEVLAKKPSSIEEFVHALTTERYMFFKEHQDLFRIFIKELTYNEEIRKEVMQHIEKEAVSRIKGIIQYFSEKGEVVPIPVNIVARNVFTTLFGYFLSRFHFFPESLFLNDEQEIDYLVQMIVGGIKGANK